MAAARNWFAEGGAAYARYRPDYPPELAAFLAAIAPTPRRAVDVGCGNGQFTCQLAAGFAEVIGVDPSGDQIANATPCPRVRYLCAPAEALTVPAASTDLVTAAQAAHWFDLPRFYAEARRIAAPGAVIALVSYGVPQFDADVADRFARFYWQEIGPFWPPERRLVESGYAGIDFPFVELAYPELEIRRDWDLAALAGYLTTWSAVRHAGQAGKGAIVTRFLADMEACWGDPARRRPVRWPIAMRLGRIGR